MITHKLQLNPIYKFVTQPNSSSLMVPRYINIQKINYFEYSVLILFALLGIFFICLSNDSITAYLSIELQSLSFFSVGFLAAFLLGAVK